MRGEPLIIPLKPGFKGSDTGNKALSLLFLRKHNFRIPLTFILQSHHYDRYSSVREFFLTELRAELVKLPASYYAVRSSAESEDCEDFTNAGQYHTVTNVTGVDGLIRAILEVWESAHSERLIMYHGKKVPQTLGCAVIIQEMIRSELAGVSFSKNPVTNHQEIVIEAVEGPGEDLVQKGVTPLRWRFRNGAFIEGDSEYRHISLIRKIADDTRRLRRLYRNHVDIEWVYDGRQLYYLQLRPVTGQRDMKIYSNKMAKEMLPGQIKPLVWSVNIPLVNGTWIKLLSEITGRLNVAPEDLAKPFYYRTYFNIAALSRIFREFGLSADALESLMMSSTEIRPSFRPGLKTFRHLFRIIRFIIDKLTFEKAFLKDYGKLKLVYADISESIAYEFSAGKYKELYNRLLEEGHRLTYLNIVMPIMMQIYNKRLKSRLKKYGIEYEQLDFNRDFPELKKLSPLPAFQRIKGMINSLPDNVRSECDSYDSLTRHPEASSVIEEIKRLQLDFGHLSESGNDFSIPKWNENPEILYNLIKKSETLERRPGLLTFSELNEIRKGRISGLRNIYLRAGRFKVYREQISSLFIFGHGLFRSLYLRLGQLFEEKGILDKPEDIFYLYRVEIDRIMEEISAGSTSSIREIISARRDEMQSTSDYILPSVIYGDHAPILETGRVRNHRGVGTSAGIYTGKTRVVRSSSDFTAVMKGEVLLIPFSDVSWTPILTMAGAIVSETGGLLSHSSIIAREMGIPALVSVENACSIGNGLTVTVDGSNGILSILNYD